MSILGSTYIPSVTASSASSMISPHLDVTLPRESIIYYPDYKKKNIVSDAPYSPSLNLTYSQPTISIYENLNGNPKIHHRVTKLYRYKTLEKWLFGDLKSLLGYLKIDNGKVNLINKESDFKSGENDSSDTANKKIDYIKENILTHRTAYKIIYKFVHATNTNWYDLHKNEKYLIQALEIGLRKTFKKKMI